MKIKVHNFVNYNLKKYFITQTQFVYPIIIDVMIALIHVLLFKCSETFSYNAQTRECSCACTHSLVHEAPRPLEGAGLCMSRCPAAAFTLTAASEGVDVLAEVQLLLRARAWVSLPRHSRSGD